MRVSFCVLAVTSLTALGCASASLDGGQRDAGGNDAATASDAGVDDATGDADGGSVADAQKTHPLCDGLAHLRLWVSVEGGGTRAAGSDVQVDNGSPIFTVDGTCSYWVGGGWSEDALALDRPFRTGKLSDADITSIEEAVPLEDVAAIADCSPNPIPDGSVLVIRTETASAICGSGTAARFLPAWMALQAIAARLWESGAPVDGAMHVSTYGSTALGRPPPYTWPIATPLSAFVPAVSDLGRRGVSRLVDDPDAARQLRALRDRYLADRDAQPGGYGAGSLQATDQSGLVFLVYMRDAIPYEDAQGLLKF